MSVVAWDGHYLTADRLVLSTNLMYRTTKVVAIETQSKERKLVAAVGCNPHFPVLVKWVKDGEMEMSFPKFQEGDDYSTLIVVGKDKKVRVYTYTHMPHIVREKFMAWGSGKDVAIGAMAMGANSLRAVEITSKYIASCGKGYDYENL